MKIYTRTGDDGTTGLYFGGRARKTDAAPMAYGDVDEAQSFLGIARAEARHADDGVDSELDRLLVALERDLWVLMAELATAPENRHKLSDGTTKVTSSMIEVLERHIDDLTERFAMPKEFVVPGQNRIAAALDVARTVVRRSERSAIAALEILGIEGSYVQPYLNRLSDLLWTMARWQERGSLSARA